MDTIPIYGSTLERLTASVKRECETRKLKMDEVTVYLHHDMNGLRARVVPRLWEEREIRGDHKDEADPFDITP